MRRDAQQSTYIRRFLLRHQAGQLLRRPGKMKTNLSTWHSFQVGSLACVVLHRILHETYLYVLARRHCLLVS